MRFTITVRKVGAKDSWNEIHEYDHVTNAAEAEKCAQEMLGKFNAALRKGEIGRELLKVVLDPATVGAIREHDWYKVNLVTLVDTGHHSCDEYKCARCGVTGKRFYLDGGVVLDHMFQRPVFDRCDTAMAYLHIKPKPPTPTPEPMKEEEKEIIRAKIISAKVQRATEVENMVVLPVSGKPPEAFQTTYAELIALKQKEGGNQVNE